MLQPPSAKAAAKVQIPSSPAQHHVRKSLPTNRIPDIITDHQEVESVFNEIEAGSDESKRDLVKHVITERVRHSVAEEQYLSHRDTPGNRPVHAVR